MLEQVVAESLQRLARPAHGVAFVFRLAQFVGEPGGAEEVGQQVRQQVAQLQPMAVLGAHRVVVQRRHGLGAVPSRLRALQNPFVPQLGHGHDAHLVGHHAAQHGGVEGEAVAGCLAPCQGGQERRRGALRGGVDADLQRGVVRAVAVGDAGEGEHPPGLRRHYGFIAGIGRVGAVFAEALDDAEHEVRPLERLAVEAQALALFPVQRREHGVRRLCDQTPHLRRVFGIAQIRAHQLLAAGPQRPGRHVGERIALGGHDLHDLGAEIGEDHGGQAGCRADAQLDDAETGERRHGRASSQHKGGTLREQRPLGQPPWAIESAAQLGSHGETARRGPSAQSVHYLRRRGGVLSRRPGDPRSHRRPGAGHLRGLRGGEGPAQGGAGVPALADRNQHPRLRFHRRTARGAAGNATAGGRGRTAARRRRSGHGDASVRGLATASADGARALRTVRRHLPGERAALFWWAACTSTPASATPMRASA